MLSRRVIQYFLWIGFLTAGLITQGCMIRPHTCSAQRGQAGLFVSPGFDMGTLPLLTDSRTRSISAENPTGHKGKGGMALPNPAELKPAASGRAADDLGQGWKVRPFLRVNAGQTVTIMDVDGPGIIQHIWLVEGLSRGHILRFYWDNENSPSIEVPVPDFFAVGHEMFGRVNSAPIVVNPANALNCYWPMPFRQHAKVTFTNENDRDLPLLAYQITFAETQIPNNVGYFHAQWRRADTNNQNPYVILDGVKGKGRYVGTFLAWTQLSKGWFGEGEIKFYMDGDDKFPTICGTGTEDYFTGSYGFPELFNSDYAGTTLKTHWDEPPPNYWSLYRWHIMDPICYDKNLRVTIQALGWGTNGKYKLMSDDIASVAYWYQVEPHAPFPKLLPLKQRARWEPPKPDGTIEGEDLKVLGKSNGETGKQDLSGLRGFGSKKAHLWWLNAQPGDCLELAVTVEEKGKYRLKMQLTKAIDYAVVQLYLDGQKIGGSIDLYNPDPVPSGELDMGIMELNKGEHKLRVEIVGANEKAVKSYLFGIDYLILERIKNKGVL